LDEHWKLKKQLSNKISLSKVDSLYEEVKERFGVLGGKIIGAGGGGFFDVIHTSKAP
jgi:D-glycero-alpha-D-manno-heptose-7-phosphate kinase